MYDLYHFYALLLFVCPKKLPYIYHIDKIDPYVLLMYIKD